MYLLPAISPSLIPHLNPIPTPDSPILPPSRSRTSEIGINPSHILAKSLTVLNPLRRPSPDIMDDADLAGPFVFCFGFALVLLLVSHTRDLGLDTDMPYRGREVADLRLSTSRGFSFRLIPGVWMRGILVIIFVPDDLIYTLID